jgi:hypothetical protein
MQYPVPQFTDVEDKIIGPLTLKQFGIIFAAAILIFLGFSATKSILVLIFLVLVFGIPALGLAFAPFNGRPIYNSIPKVIKFYSSSKVLIFHKEAHTISSQSKISDAQLSKEPAQKAASPPADSKANLIAVQELLRKTASEEQDIAGKMK